MSKNDADAQVYRYSDSSIWLHTTGRCRSLIDLSISMFVDIYLSINSSISSIKDLLSNDRYRFSCRLIDNVVYRLTHTDIYRLIDIEIYWLISMDICWSIYILSMYIDRYMAKISTSIHIDMLRCISIYVDWLEYMRSVHVGMLTDRYPFVSIVVDMHLSIDVDTYWHIDSDIRGVRCISTHRHQYNLCRLYPYIDIGICQSFSIDIDQSMYRFRSNRNLCF